MDNRAPWPQMGVVIILMALWGCSGGNRPEPKSSVLDLFTAMRESDSGAVRTLVDLNSAVVSVAGELPKPAADDSLAVPDSAAWLLGQMTGEGRLRKRWLDDNQIVIGRTESRGDTAFVEVSFLDRVTRMQYYNKMRLEFRGGGWVITKFRTM